MKNLHGALWDQTVEDLRYRLLFLTPGTKVTRKAEIIDGIKANLEGPALKAAWESLDETEQLAVAEAVYDPLHIHRPTQFQSKYGRAAEFHRRSPEQSRYSSWQSPKNATRLNLFFYRDRYTGEHMIPHDLASRLHPHPPHSRPSRRPLPVANWPCAIPNPRPSPNFRPSSTSPASATCASAHPPASRQATSLTGTALTSAQMADPASFLMFNFFTLWEMEEGAATPTLQARWEAPTAPRAVALEDLEGTGTVADPYLLHDASEMRAMRLDLNAHYRIAQDIDAAETAFWFSGRGWAPVGTSTNRFGGRLDGDGRAIRNLTVNREADSYGGLFGYTQNCMVENLELTDAHVFSNSYGGALVGMAIGSVIDGIQVTGAVGSPGSIIGGVIGFQNGGSLQRVHFEGTVTGQNYVGGMVGDLQGGGTISQASTDAYVTGGIATGGLIGRIYLGSDFRLISSKGSVTGTNQVGGLVGNNFRGNIADAYSWASVTGTTDVGGLIGLHESAARLDRGYASGAVTGSSNVGGLIGRISSSAVTHGYWDTEASGQETSAGGAGLSSVQMQQQASYPAFDFLRIWEIEKSAGPPVFRDFSGYSPGPEAVALADVPGSGVAGDPYRISTASQLHAVRLAPAAHFELEADIDLADTAIWDSGRGWEPIGISSERFTGVFDGNSHTIRKLTISRSNTAMQGLFGYVDTGAIIRNLHLEAVNAQGGNQSALLAGYANNAAFDNVTVEGTIASSGNSVGGLVGDLRGASAFVSRAFADVRIWGQQNVGGLIGYAYLSPQVRYSASTGEIHGTNGRTGGLIGWNFRGQIADVYSLAEVTGTADVGGLIGLHESSARLDRAYSSGAVAGDSNVGGLMGRNSGSAVTHGYWDMEASGQAESAGGTGLAPAAMRQAASFPAFNFDTAWTIDEGVSAPVFQDLSLHASAPEDAALASLSGSGTLADPYIVTTPAELHAARQDLTAHYRLGNDIDLTESVAWDNGLGWQPIGNSSTRFTGSFEGAGHAIRHLVINRIGQNYQGLFGDLNNGAVIRNVRIEQGHVQAQSYVGLVSGSITFGFLDGIDVQGKVVASGSYVGGIVGQLGGNSSAASRIFAHADVWATQYTGGVIGSIGASGDLRYASAHGSVTGTTQVGGVIGQNHAGRVADVYSVATVTGTDEVGGLIGRQNASVHRGFAAGPVEGTGDHVGGLVGRQSGGSTTQSAWNVDATGQATSAAGSPKTSAEMRQQATFATFNFDTAWTMEEGESAPVFRDLLAYSAQPEPVDVANLPGAGTVEAPYLIATASELQAMRQNPSAHYRLVGDIDLTDSLAWDFGRGWLPIGTTATGNSFTGTFDGNNHGIHGLTINRPNDGYQGLFGHTRAGMEIRDLQLTGAHVFGGFRSGLLVGEVSAAGDIHSIEVAGVVLGTGQYTGGAVGYSSGLALERVFADVHVEGVATTGGLVGYLYSHGRIGRSHAFGTVVGTNQVGGLVGYSHVNGRIFNSFARAAVSGVDEVGGLVGHQNHTSTSRIEHCYAVGTVSGTGTHVGGLLGRLSTGSVIHSYYNTDFSNAPGGGGEGRTTVDMTYPPATNTYQFWDFDSTWMADATSSLNDGYPVLLGSPLSRVLLVYTAGPGGYLTGPLEQEIDALADGEEVRAIAESGAAFSRWSDGVTDNPRRDLAVTGPIEVTAHFHSKARVDIDWYADHGIAPGAGQTWADLDATDWLGKGMTLQQEFLAGTVPNDPLSRFAAEVPVMGPGGAIILRWSSVPGRSYGIEWSNDLAAWQDLESAPGLPLVAPAAAAAEHTEVSFDNPSDAAGAPVFFRVRVIPEL